MSALLRSNFRYNFNLKLLITNSICLSKFFNIPWTKTMYLTVVVVVVVFNKTKVYFQTISLAASIYCFKINTIKCKKMKLMDLSPREQMYSAS